MAVRGAMKAPVRLWDKAAPLGRQFSCASAERQARSHIETMSRQNSEAGSAAHPVPNLGINPHEYLMDHSE
jgi:hypothetical protein